MTEEVNIEYQLNSMEVGDRIKLDIWDVWRMPTGWVMSIDTGYSVPAVFVPDVINVEANVTNHY